jgi:hypothetical protein
MTDKEPEELADALVSQFDELLDSPTKAKPTTAKLEIMRAFAIDLYFKIERYENIIAHQERDSRESHLTNKVLTAAGLIDEEQYSNANMLVTEARSGNNMYTDVETILKRNRREDRKHEATGQGEAA